MKKLLLSLFLVSAFAGANAQSTILSEDFEGGSLPLGWTISTAATDGGWVIGTNVAVQSGSFPIPAHTKIACSNDDKCNCVKANDL